MRALTLGPPAPLAAVASPRGTGGGVGAGGGHWGWRAGSAVLGYRSAGQWDPRVARVSVFVPPILSPTGGGAQPPAVRTAGGVGGRSGSRGPGLPVGCPAPLVLPPPYARRPGP